MSHRDQFLKVIEQHLDKPVLWGAKGPDAFDCSGLVTEALYQAGGQDLRELANAQALYDRTRPLLNAPTEQALPGDLVFYGHGEHQVTHVAVVDEYGGVISADGATSHITTLQASIANPANRVRRHTLIRFRRDEPWVAVHRNTLVDALDQVSR